MKKAFTSVLAMGLVCVAGVAWTDEDASLIINEEQEMVTTTPAPDHLKDVFDEIYSGWLFRTTETQALQLDDFDNPGMIFVDAAMDLYNAPDGVAGKSCASCHEDVSSFTGLRTRIPKINEAGTLWSMENYINNCRTERMQADAWNWSGADMQGMVALIAHQSRGMAMNVDITGPAQSWWNKGKEMYYTRYGQLELSCANCHEQNYGNMIRADHLSQGQTNGFPTYRLKQAKLISQHSRFKGCIRDTRAHTFAEGSEEFRALELYVASRGTGLSVETPAVRQ